MTRLLKLEDSGNDFSEILDQIVAFTYVVSLLDEWLTSDISGLPGMRQRVPPSQWASSNWRRIKIYNADFVKKSLHSKAQDREARRHILSCKPNSLSWMPSAKRRESLNPRGRALGSDHPSSRLRFWPSIMHPERVATKDDVIKLSYPVKTSSGYTDTLRIKKGQVST